MQPILALENVSKYYVNGSNVAAGLSKVSLKFFPGEFVAVTGESGSGKSTLAHILGGILPYEDGELYIDGGPTSHYDSADWEAYRRDHVAFISQNYGILPGASVLDNVLSALYLTGVDKDDAAVKAKEILEEVELWPLRRRRAARLSSGQKQRLAIARALAKPCSILIADEPTGNLDRENSDKVIRLLSHAAKSRLVILITHEFSEAEEFVTRHIRIHDGTVAGDIQLRDAVQIQPLKRERKAKKPVGYIAGLQLRSRPVWTAMVLLFFSLTAFAVFAFLGSFIVALDDTSTRIYQPEAFLNGDKTRIVAVRKDGEVMTQEDYDAILSLKYADHLERYGYIADYCYAYQEGVDYEKHYNVYNYGSLTDPLYMTVESVSFPYTGQFVQTVPTGISDFLTDGRLPESYREVVAGDEALLGQTVTVYIQDMMNWSGSAYIKLEAEVVGITDAGSGLYFSDELGAALTLNFLGSGVTLLPWYEDLSTPVEYVDYCTAEEKARAAANGYLAAPFLTECVPMEDSICDQLKYTEVLISHNTYILLRNWLWFGEDALSTFQMYYGSGTDLIPQYLNTDIGQANIAGIHDSTLTSVVCVTPERFANYLEENMIGCGNQVSITISDYAYTDRVISALEEAGYYALSPYRLGSATVDPDLAQQRILTLAVCLGALVAVMVLQMIVLRVLFGMEHESYRILSNMGLTWKNAKQSVLLQILGFAAAGQILGFGGIALCSALGVERIKSLTRYLEPIYWLVLSLTAMAAAALAAWLILRHLKNRIYPQSAAERDLAPRRKEAAL